MLAVGQAIRRITQCEAWQSHPSESFFRLSRLEIFFKTQLSITNQKKQNSEAQPLLLIHLLLKALSELQNPGPKDCWTTGNQKNPHWKLATSFCNLSNLSVRENSRCNYLSLKKGVFQQASEYASTPHTTHSEPCSHWNKHSALPRNPPPYQTVHSDCFPSRLSLTSGRNEARRGSCSIKTPQRPQLTLQIWIGTFHADLD